MNNIKIDMSAWAKRNMWILPSGDLGVRPGLRKIYTPPAGRVHVAGFSVRDTATLEAVHYVVDVPSTKIGAPVLRVLDEMWDEVFSITLETSAIPEVVTHAVVMNQIVISSPSFPTLWGFIGGPLVVAEPVDSLTLQPSIPIPRGLCTTWATSRVVWADGASIFVSDPVTVVGGSPQSIIGPNQIVLDAPIYGLHEGPSGELIACTSNGVRIMSKVAAASGQVVVGDWQRASDYQCLGFNTTCISRDRVWGVSRRGIVDVLTKNEIQADDYHLTRHLAKRQVTADFKKNSKVWPSRDGPILSSSFFKAFAKTELDQGFLSWWDFADPSEGGIVVGQMLETDAREIILTEGGAYRILGNFDGGVITQELGTVRGVLSGRAFSTPDESRVIRRCDFSSDTFGSFRCATRDGDKEIKTTPKAGRFAGTTEATPENWGEVKVRRPPVQSRRFHWSTRSDDLSIEISVDDPESRLDRTLSIDFKGPGKRRPTS